MYVLRSAFVKLKLNLVATFTFLVVGFIVFFYFLGALE